MESAQSLSQGNLLYPDSWKGMLACIKLHVAYSIKIGAN